MQQKADFCHRSGGDTVQCDLCHHYCRLGKGRRGICGTRVNRLGTLFSENYGRPAGLAADPVEKKPLYHFLPGSRALSFGTRGCNFRCENCQNWRISQSRSRAEDTEPVPPLSIVRTAIESGCSSIACTYNEPTIFAEYALDTMREARKQDMKTIWVSNGFMSDNCLDAIEPLLDAINIDLKSMRDAFYRKVCGARLGPVLDNLKRIARTNIHLEITTLLIPGFSDDGKMLREMAEFIAGELGSDTPWHLSGFVPGISWKMRDIPPTMPQSLETAIEIGNSAGLVYIYSSHFHQDTHCPACGASVIERQGYRTTRRDRNGRCRACGASIPNLVLASRPGPGK
ncbi:AmmeMemoRadiSam system radical SAM enzyme [Prosthecochloris sp. GSB1]|uniref:AmmeMemoRadiSam system radical SAM enzyme n=1 Tax=Prosthecochloris sp. GSB1 TaxID=281093 RepID=UPI000B8C6F15|nr:AmmeMemoRadiSam system radical SAM enzyme [Prosthecochloris sp. GSB1]ASQ89750.1 AmmeMemoRadiSam system radical SAM enzyme [Prosthecochloris sp. GSB1]